ncbi:MAG TPA: hypothetical protein VMS12_06685, partial [Thermoanaerobaculia bacterium]|nr:hypothetical protein [Thermoanaerobaculia bacterium]
MNIRVCLLAGLFFLAASAASAETISVRTDGAVLSDSGLDLEITLEDAPGPIQAQVLVDGTPVETVELEPGANEVSLRTVRLAAGSHRVEVRSGARSGSIQFRVIPGWLSILPPVVAILLALLLKDAVIALFAGVLAGTLVLFNWNPVIATGRALDSFIAPALADLDHAKLLIFTALVGGMVGAVSRSGGTHGIVERLRGYATTARRGQVATWLMGIFIFFDDYANTLIVGSTMRPITDRLRISRE